MNTALSRLCQPQVGWEITCALVQKKKRKMIIRVSRRIVKCGLKQKIGVSDKLEYKIKKQPRNKKLQALR